jgi:hypothetical protein
MVKDVCTEAITRAEYDAFDPHTQGYVSYMQAHWENSEIPKKCHYPEKSEESKLWHQGAQAACIDVIDTEE